MTIPQIFHRVWIDGPDPIPEGFERYWAGFKSLHPDWEFFTWIDSGDLGWIANHAEYDAQTTHAGRSDVVRYEAVATFGGVYVDTDVEPLRPFDELLGDERPFVGWESDRLLCPTVIGGPPGHPALVALVEGLPEWVRQHRGRPPNMQTGPHFLTAMWMGRTDVRRLPRDAFYPVGWWERDRLNGDYPKTSFAVHHWAMGWAPEQRKRQDERARRRSALRRQAT